MFIHDAVLEAVICGETEVPANQYASEVKNLKRYNHRTNSTGMEMQYQLLSQVTPNPDQVFCIAARAHANKNRSDRFLPR